MAVSQIQIDNFSASRARGPVGLGYGHFDAFHLAAVELVTATVLLITDDALQKRAARNLGNPKISLRNPLF